MKALTALLLAVSTTGISAQATPAPVVTSDPVVWAAHEIFARQSQYMVAAAEQMPADKYTYAPTPEQMTFGKIIAHTTQANIGVCQMLSDNKAPASVTPVAETAPKDVLIAHLRASFDFCAASLAGLKDARLGDTITYFRNARVPRSRALVELTDDLEDHYSQLAIYLRLNGILPPSAAPAKPTPSR